MVVQFDAIIGLVFKHDQLDAVEGGPRMQSTNVGRAMLRVRV
jgi:hypothetical protein